MCKDIVLRRIIFKSRASKLKIIPSTKSTINVVHIKVEPFIKSYIYYECQTVLTCATQSSVPIIMSMDAYVNICVALISFENGIMNI
jgi:hypothetical protein